MHNVPGTDCLSEYTSYVPVPLVRDGVPQLVSTVPLRAGSTVHVLIDFRGLFCDYWLDFREMS